MAERFRKHLRPEARSPHAEEDDVADVLLANILGKGQENIDARAFRLDDAEPAEPRCPVGRSPETGVGGPEPVPLCLTPPRFERHCDCVLELRRKLAGLAVEL